MDIPCEENDLLSLGIKVSHYEYDMTMMKLTFTNRDENQFDANGNLTKVTEYDNNNNIRFVTSMTYDDKLSPKMGIMNMDPIGKNNVLTYQKKDAKGVLKMDYVYTYEYSSEGYPTKIVTRDKMGGTETTANYTMSCH